jgi:hypothetical protein
MGFASPLAWTKLVTSYTLNVRLLSITFLQNDNAAMGFPRALM